MATQSIASRMVAAVVPFVSKRVFPDAVFAAGSDRSKLLEVAKKRRKNDGPRPDLVLQRSWARATTVVAGRDLHLLTPRNGSTGRVLFYLHGGAFVVGPSTGEWLFAARLADALGVDLALYDYPKVPESDSVDIRAATLQAWQVISERYEPDNISIAGTSAGGGLAVSTMLQLWRDGQQLPNAAVLISPWLDLTISHPDASALAATDKVLPIDKVRRDGELYASTENPRDPLLSPRFAGPSQLSQLPPAVVMAGDQEILLPEASEFVDKINAAGAKAVLHVEPFGQHVGPLAPTPEGKAVTALAVASLQRLM